MKVTCPSLFRHASASEAEELCGDNAGWLAGELPSLYEYKSMLGCFIKDADNTCFWSTEVEVRFSVAARRTPLKAERGADYLTPCILPYFTGDQLWLRLGCAIRAGTFNLPCRSCRLDCCARVHGFHFHFRLLLLAPRFPFGPSFRSTNHPVPPRSLWKGVNCSTA